MEYYVLIIWKDVQAKLHGGYRTVRQRDKKAQELREQFGTTSSYFPIEATEGSEISIDCYSAEFFQ